MDVVVAPATPWGHSALAVVRLSGDDLSVVVDEVCLPLNDRALRPGEPRRVYLRDPDGIFDDGVLVLAAAPRTYTGENTAEITCHGNPQIVDRLIASFVSAGARAAQPPARHPHSIRAASRAASAQPPAQPPAQHPHSPKTA